MARKDFIPLSPPHITAEEIAGVVEVLESGWITTGAQTKKFEGAFSQYVGSDAALALNSCTAGLHIALVTLGLSPGDEVITTPMTFCASVNVIEHVGATPILVDIEPDTLNIDTAKIESAITSRTKALMPVHYSGHPVEMNSIKALAEDHNLFIIEDAAHAVAAAYEGQMIGSIGDFTAFSFYATKNLTTGEGGMLTGREDLIDKAKVLSLHGMSKDAWNRYSTAGSWYYEVVAPGFKYNMPDIQAALGLVQLRRLSEMQFRRQAIVEQYNQVFSKIEALQTPIARENVDHAWHLYVLRLNLAQLTIDRAQFIEELKARQIGTSVHFIPIHLHPYYHEKYGWEAGHYPVAYEEYQKILSLPLHSGLTDSDVEEVISAVTEVVDQHRV